MSKKNCPNKNDKEYKALAAIVGDSKAHTIYDKNNGNPVSLNADGTPSSIYNSLVATHGEYKAIQARANMFTDLFQKQVNSDVPIKQGVSELFESNPELANAVYEAAGFKTKSEVEVSNKVFNPDMAPDGYSKIITIDGKYIGEFALLDINDETHLSGSLGARTEIDEEYRGKGYGYQAYIELAKQVKREGKVLVSDTNMTKDAIRVWEKLVREGYANKVKRLVEGSDNLKEEVYIIDNSKLPTLEVSPQQKQQAQQQYSQYLDTIFPDSPVKDIVHRGYNGKRGNYFTPDKSYSKVFGKNVDSVLINGDKQLDLRDYDVELDEDLINNTGRESEIERLQVEQNIDLPKLISEHDIIKGIDAGNGVISYYTKNTPHILGSKQDIEGFKEFVENNNTKYDASRDLEVNENGAVTLPDGQVINLLNKGYRTKQASRHIMRLDVLEVSEHMNNIISHIEAALPGINVIRESYATVRGTKHENDRAWVDGSGIHLNMQSMNYDTPVHEIAHIWMKALKETHPGLYQNLLLAIEASIKDNKALFDKIQSKYPEKKDNDLLEEYAATIAGFTSAQQVKKFMYRNNKYVTDKESASIYHKFMNMVDNIWQSIKTAFKTLFVRDGMRSAIDELSLNTANLNSIFKALTEDILTGRSIINLGINGVESLMDKYYSNGNAEASKILFDNYIPINQAKQVIPYLMARPDVFTGFDEQQKEAEVEYIVNSSLGVAADGNYTYHDLGKKHVFPSNIPLIELKKRIMDEVINPRYAYLNSFSENLVNVIHEYRKYGAKKNIDKIIEQVFGKKLGVGQYSSILDALQIIGYNQPIEKIIAYKDLATHPTLSHLYHPAVDGLNYLVIIHNSQNSQLDISLIDIANGKMSWEDNMLPSNAVNLGYTFGYDKPTFTMSNKQSDIRKTLVALTLASINKRAKENGINIRVRKVGVVGNNNLHVNSFMISDIQEALDNARKLFSLPELSEQSDTSSDNYNYLQSLVADDDAFNTNSILQSYVNMLESFYADKKQELHLSSKFVNDVLRDTKMLKERQLKLERRKDYMDNEEHKLISVLLQYMEHHIDINGSQMNDISRKFALVTNPHNVKHDAIQMFSIDAERVKSKIITKVNEFKDEFKELAEKSIKSHDKNWSLTYNKPEDIFGRLFKKGEVILKDGITRKPIVLYNQLYGSYNINEAKAAGLTDEDIALADFIIERTKKQFVENIRHNFNMSGKGLEKTDLQIRQEVDSRLLNGRIPVMPMTRDEMMRKGKFLEAFKKNFEKNAKGEYTFGENTEVYDEVNFAFNNQYDITQQYLQMGLQTVSGDANVFNEIDLSRLDRQTMNLEYTMNMFIHDGNRKHLLDTELIPAYHRIKQWLNVIKVDYGKGKDGQKIVEQYLDDYYNRIVLRKNKDENDKIDPLLRNMQHAFSFIALGYRPTVWMRSTYYNMQAQMLESMAKSAATMLSSDESKTLNIPGVGDMLKANQLLLTDFAKINKLGKKFSIINSSEMDAIESIFTTMADKHAFKTQIAQLGNYYSDMIARLVAMTAFMVKDGSFDAHSFDKETGKLSYDVTKDKRFYENGDWKSNDAKIKFSDLKQSLENDELTDNGNVIVGYDYRDANTRFKWYSDKFIIGSMDEYQKALLGQTAFGALALQFRNYLPDKLFNLIGSNRLTSYGAVREIRMNPDNEMEVIRKQIEIEGSWASMWYYLKDVVNTVKLKDKTIKELNSELSPIRRHNLAKEFSRAVLLTSITAGLYVMVKAGMSDRDRDKLDFLTSELNGLRPWVELNEGSILPISRLISDAWSIMTGEANWNRAIRYFGLAYDGLWYLELLTDYDKILFTDRENKKVAEMNEKEKKEYLLKQERSKEVSERNKRTKQDIWGEEV